MKNMTTLRHIAGLYLDIYSAPRDLTRPLTPEQVKEAGVLFLDLLVTHEVELLIAEQRKAQEQKQAGQPASDLTLKQIACDFVDAYKRKKSIGEPLDRDATESLSHLFLELIDEYQGNQ